MPWWARCAAQTDEVWLPIMSAPTSPSPSPERPFFAASGIFGFLGVALGAFGAHGLRGFVAGLPDAEQRLEWWRTGAQYHLLHAIALGLSAWAVSRHPGRSERASGYAFALGTLIFSGSLYAMALGAPRFFGAITPLGGLSYLVGWACITASALRR